jgi:hypothetical protein
MNIRTLVALSFAALLLVSAAESRAATPCCAIVDIGASGVVTAREAATRRTFEFQVADRRVLATLEVGQLVHADFTTMRVSVKPDGIDPCCSILSASPATTGRGPDSGHEGEIEVMAASPCCAIVANPALRRLGRIVVAYPEKVAARIDVFKAGDTKAVASDYGDVGFDLLPGTYDVSISGKRVAGVTVQSGHDTQIKVGVLRVNASDGTRVDLADPAGEKGFASGYGTQLFGLPIGAVGVEIAGQTETVAIEAGQVTEF